jgi:hypothetical protein
MYQLFGALIVVTTERAGLSVKLRFLFSERAEKGSSIPIALKLIGNQGLEIEVQLIRGGQLQRVRFDQASLSFDTISKSTEDGDGVLNGLNSLWSDCVRLILEELGFCARIWWIGTGLASSLPFHAAGVHSVGSAENTLSRAISSYTPTIKALRHSRENAALHSDEHSVLVVTMRQTPGQTDLPGVEAEEEAVCSVFRHPHRVQSLKQPNKNAVLRNLGDFGIVHFACHGSSDLGDPSSRFLALQGDSDTVPDKLTVQEMANLNLGRAWLAYLSACSTAENDVPDLSDEVLHLASAFQVAGFGHVIASMWTSKDAICVQVSSVFYRHLTC